MDDLINYLLKTFEHFSDPRKRVFLGYIFLSIIIAFCWLIFFKKFNFYQSLRKIFDKKVLFSNSSKADLILFFLNRGFLMFFSPLLITQLAIATLIFKYLNSINWLSEGMYSSVPKTFIVMSFTFFIFLLDDFTKFLVHRWMHKWPILWSLHKVHHSAETLTPMTIYRTHPLEGIVFTLRGSFTQGLSIAIFVFFFGNNVDIFTVIGVNVIVFSFNVAGSNLRHSHISIRYLPWIEHIFISPAQHQLHHSLDKKHHDKNFGASLAIWDWIFGSLHHSEDIENLKLGVEDHFDNSLKTLYLKPIFEIFHISKNFFIKKRKFNIFR